MLDRGERRDWALLREDYRAVILADAGAGKTFELKAEAARLDARGHAAFFIRIEDIDDAFGCAFEVGSAGGFESWLCGAEEAWFFLDSVDEVRLEAPRAFEAALRAFATRIHDARHRAHVYVSSRPYARGTSRDASPRGRRASQTNASWTRSSESPYARWRAMLLASLGASFKYRSAKAAESCADTGP